MDDTVGLSNPDSVGQVVGLSIESVEEYSDVWCTESVDEDIGLSYPDSVGETVELPNESVEEYSDVSYSEAVDDSVRDDGVLVPLTSDGNEEAEVSDCELVGDESSVATTEALEGWFAPGGEEASPVTDSRLLEDAKSFELNPKSLVLGVCDVEEA